MQSIFEYKIEIIIINCRYLMYMIVQYSNALLLKNIQKSSKNAYL